MRRQSLILLIAKPHVCRWMRRGRQGSGRCSGCAVPIRSDIDAAPIDYYCGNRAQFHSARPRMANGRCRFDVGHGPQRLDRRVAVDVVRSDDLGL